MLEESKLEYIKKGIKYNLEELNYTNADITIWLDGVMFIESDCSEEYFNSLVDLRNKYVEGAF